MTAVADPKTNQSLTEAKPPPKGQSYWGEVWKRYRRRPMAMLALGYVLLLALIGLCSPLIVGTRPIVAHYKGSYYFPFLGYFNDRWENPIFFRDKFRGEFPENLKKNDPDSWAIWPLVFQDPNRRVRQDEWPGREGNPTGEKGAPNQINLFGTTPRGMDVFAQIVHGSRLALLVGFVSMGIASAVGITLGALAGYFGGWVDIILSRLIELVMCLPSLVLILAIVAVLERPTIWHIMVIIGLTGWTGIARLTRGEFMKLRALDYVSAAKALGAGHTRIIFRHILPNSLAPVLVPISFGIASAILVENALRFLGVGPMEGASWGSLLSEGQRNLKLWWLILFPGAAIFFTVMAYNLIGEGLQAATDPRLREGTK
jgi:peptide/nickel transport system permease protein